MARADLLCDLIKYGLAHDDKRFIQSAEAVCAEEREKQHTVLANRIEKIVLTAANTKQKSVRNHTIVKSSGLAAQTLFHRKTLCSDVNSFRHFRNLLLNIKNI